MQAHINTYILRRYLRLFWKGLKLGAIGGKGRENEGRHEDTLDKVQGLSRGSPTQQAGGIHGKGKLMLEMAIGR